MSQGHSSSVLRSLWFGAVSGETELCNCLYICAFPDLLWRATEGCMCFEDCETRFFMASLKTRLVRWKPEEMLHSGAVPSGDSVWVVTSNQEIHPLTFPWLV
jgi:hypothetical protein